MLKLKALVLGIVIGLSAQTQAGTADLGGGTMMVAVKDSLIPADIDMKRSLEMIQAGCEAIVDDGEKETAIARKASCYETGTGLLLKGQPILSIILDMCGVSDDALLGLEESEVIPSECFRAAVSAGGIVGNPESVEE